MEFSKKLLLLSFFVLTPFPANATSSSESVEVHVEKNQVGIGTQKPTVRLDVQGAVRIGDNGEACGKDTAGALRYVGTLQLCDGTAWRNLAIQEVQP